jgi:hypothetical protein
MDSMVERRRAGRVACRLPVRLVRSGHITLAATEDLSRTGVRIRLGLEQLGLGPTSDLGSVARRISTLLGDAFVAEFQYELYGNLVRRVLRVARLAQIDPDGGAVDLGCELRVPLEEEETKVLGVDLPPILGRVDEPEEESASAVGHGEEGNGADHRMLMAYLSPPPERQRPPLRGRAEDLTPQGLRLKLPEVDRMGSGPETADATSLLVAFDDVYGSELSLLLVEGADPIWSGPTRLTGVESRRGSTPPRIHLGFRDPLAPAELVRLGLA